MASQVTIKFAKCNLPSFEKMVKKLSRRAEKLGIPLPQYSITRELGRCELTNATQLLGHL